MRKKHSGNRKRFRGYHNGYPKVAGAEDAYERYNTLLTSPYQGRNQPSPDRGKEGG